MAQEVYTVVLQALLAVSFILSLILEAFIHRHIVALNLPASWRLSIYFDVWAVLSLTLSVIVDGYPSYLITILILASPWLAGLLAGFFRTMGL